MKKPTNIQTGLINTGRQSSDIAHTVAVGTERASTVLFPTYDQFTAKNRPFFYGRYGTATHRAFEESIRMLEGAEHVFLTSSGLSAMTLPIMAFALPGSHLLITDSTYDPTRNFCQHFLAQRGVETTFYDPRIGGGIKSLIRPNTSLILAESPGSLTFEIQDIPAISTVARAHEIPLLVDATWSSGILGRALDLGADISLLAATKYVVGHADCLLGTIATNNPNYADIIKRMLGLLGNNVSADDVYLAQRGLRTLASRMAMHEQNGLTLARWLEQRDEVKTLLHPAFASHPDHQLWKRDFLGSNGLFGVVLHENNPAKIRAFFDALDHFGMGYSWGGFESLCIPVWPKKDRDAVAWTETGQLIRFHTGLENIDDLIADVEQAFAAMKKA